MLDFAIQQLMDATTYNAIVNFVWGQRPVPCCPRSPRNMMSRIARASSGRNLTDERREAVGRIPVGEWVPGSRKVELPESLGFRDGKTSVHTSRTMMLSELSLVLEHVAAGAKAEEYMAAIVGDNILGKPTQSTRKRTALRLAELYSLDRTHAVFRLLRHFWASDASARPLLGFLAAVARDPLLRDTSPFVLAIPIHSDVNSSQVADHLEEKYPSRFKPSTRLSTAQNLASSWTQAGYLAGKVNKKRSSPVVTPGAAAFAMALGYLCGLRGKRLFSSPWARMLDRSPDRIAELAADASRHGWLSCKGVGSVVEIGFPDLLTSREEKASHESH